MKKSKLLFVWVGILLLSTLACRISSVEGLLPKQDAESILEDAAPLVENIVAPTDISPVSPIVLENMQQSEAALVALYDYASKGVVAIQTLDDQGGGLGSGFVYDSQGHIVTNYHVVEGAADLEVDFASGIKVRGEVIATDLDSDIAVLQVSVNSADLFPLPMGDSDQLKVGQTVVAIGNPFGLSGTMTKGIVSAKGRTLESLHQTEDGTTYSAGDLIQTDASINPGNSGGPLLNLNGEIIGLNRAIRTSGVSATGEPVNSGIGFAISSNIIRRVVPRLIEDGHFDYPYLGISALEQLSLIQQEELGIAHQTGAYITDIVAGGPADSAGLQGGIAADAFSLPRGGDLIIAVDGHPVQVFGDLLSYLFLHKSPGDQIVLTIIRNGEEKEIALVLEKRP